MPTLTSIAEEILANAKRIDAYIAEKGLPEPTFEHDSLADLPEEIDIARNELVNSTHTLKKLAQGPVAHVTEILFGWADFLSLRAIHSYKFHHAVPLSGASTYASIASSSGLSPSLTRRLLRHAMSNFLFAETPAGLVQHTAATALLARSPGFEAVVGLQALEFAPAGARLLDAAARFPGSQEPTQTAYGLANGTALPMFAFLGRHHPRRVAQFAAGMGFWTAGGGGGGGWDLRHLVRAGGWAALDRPGAVLVDVGGGEGHVSAALARATAHLRFVVQDLPHVARPRGEPRPAEAAGRVRFAAQDFLEPQRGAAVAPGAPPLPPDAYLFRWVFHNWSDKYCVKILRNLLPAIKTGTKILIYETVLDEEPLKDFTEKLGLNLDLVMAACFNGCERSKSDWLALLAAADERFVLENVTKPKGSTMSLVEVTWTG